MSTPHEATNMEVQVEIKELKKTLSDMDKRITQLTIVVQDICNHLPPIQKDPQRPKKSPEMAAALAKISELKESNLMSFEAIPGIENLEIHQHDSSTNSKRAFSQFSEPLSSTYEKLLKTDRIKPLFPTPLPQKLPSYHNPKAFCAFHQMPGHDTDECHRLRHRIQNLIDNKTITFPLSPKIPNTASSPMPEHKPNIQVNPVSLKYSIPATEPEPTVLMPEDLGICFLKSTKAQKPRWVDVTENKKWAMDDVTLGRFSFATAGGSSHSQGF